MEYLEYLEYLEYRDQALNENENEGEQQIVARHLQGKGISFRRDDNSTDFIIKKSGRIILLQIDEHQGDQHVPYMSCHIARMRNSYESLTVPPEIYSPGCPRHQVASNFWKGLTSDIHESSSDLKTAVGIIRYNPSGYMIDDGEDGPVTWPDIKQLDVLSSLISNWKSGAPGSLQVLYMYYDTSLLGSAYQMHLLAGSDYPQDILPYCLESVV